FCLVHRHRDAKFLLRAAGEVRCYICDTNIGRHFVVELGLSTIGPVGGADPADEIFLFCCGHMLSFPAPPSNITNRLTRKRTDSYLPIDDAGTDEVIDWGFLSATPLASISAAR